MAAEGQALAEILRGMPREERVPVLSRLISDRVATKLGLPEESIDTNAPFGQLAPVLSNIPTRWSQLIQPFVVECLGIRHFHLYEASLTNTIGQLASYLASELDPVPVPAEPLANADPNGPWAWSTPTPFHGTSRVSGKMAFVLCTGRSGTSLFRSMLGCHDQVYAPNELHLVNFDNMGQRREDMHRLWQHWMDVGLLETLRDEFGLSRWDGILKVKQLADQSVPVAQVYDLIQSRMAGRWLIDKTPTYSRHPLWLQRAEQMFDSPRYIFMTRHPYAVMDSFMRARFYRYSGDIWGDSGSNPWHAAEAFWAQTNRNILEFVQQIPASRWMRVNYEGLMQDTPGVLSQVCEFLSIPFDERMLDPYLQERKVASNLQDRAQVDHSIGETWREKRPPHQLSQLTRQVADKLGYPLP